MTRRQFLISAALAGSRAEWSKQRQQLLAGMQLVMGPLPKGKRGRPEVTVLETVELDGHIRQKITYLSEGDDRVPAYLLLPKVRKGRVPAMLCLHQTVKIGKGEPVGLGGRPNLRYAQELAERGYVTLAPDYPNFGDYVFDPYQHGYASASMKGIWNHMRAVDLLESLPEVARDRIGAIGHSLGGHNSLFVAAFDERLRTMVTSCGFTSFPRYKGGDLTGWSHKGYMPRIVEQYGKDPARMPFDFPDLLRSLAPRALFINAPIGDSNFDVTGVKDCVRAAMETYSGVFRAADRLVAVHPDCGHDFPPEIREQAYRFLDRWLGHRPRSTAA